MLTYRTEIVSRALCGADVLVLRLAKPAGYTFTAGQWFRVTVDTAQGPDTRTFSHAAAPADATIDVATRLSSTAFKQALSALGPGDTVEVSAPGGRPSLPTDVRKVGFLVGGVGITPVRSVLRDRVSAGARFDDAVLLYANRDDSCEPFLGELLEMAPHGVCVERVLERPPAGWAGASGFITPELVGSAVDEAASRHWMVAGPPAMVDAMDRVLDAVGVPDALRHVERFGTTKAP